MRVRLAIIVLPINVQTNNDFIFLQDIFSIYGRSLYSQVINLPLFLFPQKFSDFAYFSLVTFLTLSVSLVNCIYIT